MKNYITHVSLDIIKIEPTDFGTYFCVAKNSLGELDGAIKLQGSLLDYNMENLCLHLGWAKLLSKAIFWLKKDILFEVYFKSCFSTSGTQSSFGGPPDFSHIVKNHNFNINFIKLMKSQPYKLQKFRNNKMS